MPIRITSTSPGGYCCGMAHPRGIRTYPDDWFTDDQVEELNAHPQLTAERYEHAAPAAKTAKKKAVKKTTTRRVQPKPAGS